MTGIELGKKGAAKAKAVAIAKPEKETARPLL
jgi:hypothetical protein